MSHARRDIQGLRAFAVLAVIADHLVGWPSGGFVGVDVFFVISGFLITGLLLREHARTGSISFRGFYRRRIKRILPAATLVIIVTLIASWSVFAVTRFVPTAWDAVWATVFASNWHFAIVGTDYFQANAPLSPFQHYWSLGVEEQFYLVWPLLMLGLFALAAKTRLPAIRVVAGVLIGLAAVSFAWALWESRANPAIAYFSTFSRAWELAVGAAIAVSAALWERMPAWPRPWLAWIGVVGLVASVLLVNPRLGFPAPAALLPVLSTALVLLAGIGRPPHPSLWLLTNPVSRYVGDISYSLYLWHWPVIVLGVALMGIPHGRLKTLFGVIIVVVSVLSYHLVENPLRRRQWRTTRWLKPSSWKVPRWYAVCAAAGVVGTVALVGGVAIAQTQAPAPIADKLTPLDLTGTPPELAALQRELWAAASVELWPDDLHPTMDQAIAGEQAPKDISACGHKELDFKEQSCTWGDPDAPKTAVVVGDSTALGYVAAIRSIVVTDPEWRVLSYGTFGCNYTDSVGEITPADCAVRKAATAAAIKRLKPDVVFITNIYAVRTPEGVAAPETPEQHVDSVAAFIARWQDSAGKIVIIAPPPSDVSIATCYSRASTVASCTDTITEHWSAVSNLEAALARRLGGVYLSSEDWFCTQGWCPPFIGTIPTRKDLNHATPQFQERIAPVVIESLRAVGVF